MNLLPFFEWCDSTAIGVAIRDSRIWFPVIECIHILALAVLLGTVVVLSLRLLGAWMTDQPVLALARSLAPLTNGSLAVILITGITLFLSEALKCYENPPFWAKMTALLLALIFHFTAVRASARKPDLSRLRGIAVGTVSLCLWFAVATGGRAIGFY